MDSVISLSSANKSNSITDIGVCKLGGTTTTGFGEVGAMSEAESGYGSIGYTSKSVDFMTRMARIKEMKNMSGLSSRERFHDDDGVVQLVVGGCLASLIIT